ncbi:PilN domain-containing protein [Massilia suwonensis]|uniref:PilN domain-containing protein n=1 Tax=Massilia suwonensis TaxID=648895 RepID=A0ABW0MS16_9BURK
MRKPVRLDFAPPSLRRTLLRAPLAARVSAIGALALCAVALVQVFDYREAREEVDAQLAALQARAATPVAAPSAPRTPVSEQEALAVNAAIAQLNLPWRALHDAVRAATPQSVALLALEPDAKRRVLRITAEAKNSDDMLAYVSLLEREEWFASVTLVRHEVVEQDPNRPLRFQLDAGWEAP